MSLDSVLGRSRRDLLSFLAGLREEFPQLCISDEIRSAITVKIAA